MPWLPGLGLHVTKEQKDKLNALRKDVVERMTAKSATESESVVKARTGKWFGIIWGQFNDEFGTKEHGLQSLEREKFEAAKSWFVQYRASKDKNFKRVNPQKYRNTLTSGIFTNAGKLGWPDEEVHEFAGKVLGRSEAVASFKDLGNNQLELIRDRVRYEKTKRTAKTGQARARKKPKFARPKSQEAKVLLEAILAHGAADQRGLTETGLPAVQATRRWQRFEGRSHTVGLVVKPYGFEFPADSPEDLATLTGFEPVSPP